MLYPLELIRSKSALVSGSLISMLTIVKSLPSGYSRDLQDLKPALWNASKATINVLQIMTSVVNSLEIHEEKMREMVLNSGRYFCGYCRTACSKKGDAFPLYPQGGWIVKESVLTGKPSLKLLRNEDIRKLWKKLNVI